MLTFLILVLGSYFVGSVSAAVIVANRTKLPDPRSAGSGNPGATNILRLGGKRAAALTLFGDLIKGTLAIAVARYFSADTLLWGLCGGAVFLGHLYPVFFGFKGGKGVATAFGVYLGLEPLTALVLFAVWLLTAAGLRYASLASLASAAAAPLCVWFIQHDWPLLAMSIGISALLAWRHRANIRRLLAGDEPRIGRSAK